MKLDWYLFMATALCFVHVYGAVKTFRQQRYMVASAFVIAFILMVIGMALRWTR